ncbi:hypothetical protein NUU61_008937 [Penicillium alfredii]|uniref:Eisosome protein 1 n=1 Tax=Penicillium alfredii TaxID=1506179 RepID=A0A9W9JWP5_9EURO|nr:uncharacterized protein NUU61_008937 [Penicillium alfredii]KAJ5084358.1 hypothetical protein NUU61_008937 [Penicillium alfredii]
MATAQQLPGSTRLADDAATAALYVTHPQRKAEIRDPSATDTQHFNPRVTGGTPNLSHASAGAALAHAKTKPVEVWRPGRLAAAEKAALCVKDYTPPEVPQPSTQYSPEGLEAAVLAVRDQKGMTSLLPTATGHKHDISADQARATTGHHQAQDRARRAATGAYAITRQRAEPTPTEPVISSDSPYARSAAGASQRAHVEVEDPLGHLDSATEASRIHHIANTNARLYTSSPPVASEIEDRNRRNSLRAAAISMAKDMYDVTGTKDESELDPAVSAPQNGQDRLRYRKTVSAAGTASIQKAMTLQDAAQKRAAEKLARMHDENAEYQMYYGTAPQPQRSRLATRRKRTSSDADASQIDAEQSREIRNQMSSLRSKLNRVDEQRQKDREMLMQAARRNVDAALQDMEMKLYTDTGRPPPSLQKEWDEAAQERVRQEAKSTEWAAQGDRVNIGARQFVDMADVEAIARSRLQPALDEITEQAEQQRAHDVEERLDAEEQQRHATVEHEREADMRAEAKRGKEPRKRESKGLGIFLWRRKTKRARVEKPAEEEAPAEAPTATGAVAQEAPAEPEAAAAPETAISREATAEETPGEPETAGAAAVVAAAPSKEPTRDDAQPEITKTETAQRDAAAVGSGVSAMHTIQPVTSPRADSKLKNWFRDRLVRRSSGPIPVYPHQPGPDFPTDSEPAFTGGAALAGKDEPRGAALSSHPVTGTDLPSTQNGSSSRNGNNNEVTKSLTGESGTGPSSQQNGNNKRHRLRRSFLKSVSRGTQEPKTNGVTKEGDSRRGSEAVSEPKDSGTEIQDLRHSAVEQGLPVPPALGETVSTGRESRFSEDL